MAGHLTPSVESIIVLFREYKQKLELITADFSYVRWLGDRKGIEEQTQTWDKIIVDRREDLLK